MAEGGSGTRAGEAVAERGRGTVAGDAVVLVSGGSAMDRLACGGVEAEDIDDGEGVVRVSEGVRARVRERGRRKATFRNLSNGDGCKGSQFQSRQICGSRIGMHDTANSQHIRGERTLPRNKLGATYRMRYAAKLGNTPAPGNPWITYPPAIPTNTNTTAPVRTQTSRGDATIPYSGTSFMPG